jgi:hypothetical protein
MTSSETIHVWSRCHNCGLNPIIGPCFRCETCPSGPDNDLCTTCHEGYRRGSVVHPVEPVTGTMLRTHEFGCLVGAPAETFTPWLSVPQCTSPSPSVPSGFLVRPEFLSGRQSMFGGYAFVARLDSQAVLLTALHVMDELIKGKGIDATTRNPGYTGAELPAHVTSVRLYNLLKNPWALHLIGSAGPMLVLPHARTAEDEPFSSRDIAAFRVPHPQGLHPIPLATREPKPGDPVWLTGAMPDGTRTRLAVCLETSPRTFIFRYEEAKEVPKYCSGAAILDRHGEVVGINIGLGRFGRHELGHANPLSSIRAHLHGALRGT